MDDDEFERALNRKDNAPEEGNCRLCAFWNNTNKAIYNDLCGECLEEVTDIYFGRCDYWDEFYHMRYLRSHEAPRKFKKPQK